MQLKIADQCNHRSILSVAKSDHFRCAFMQAYSGPIKRRVLYSGLVKVYKGKNKEFFKHSTFFVLYVHNIRIIEPYLYIQSSISVAIGFYRNLRLLNAN
jgi:hypothetical protein